MLSIREVQTDDAPGLAEIYSYYVDKTAVSFEYDAPTSEEFVKRINKTDCERYAYDHKRIQGKRF